MQNSALNPVQFVAVGINHHRADVATREAFALTASQQDALLAEARILDLKGVLVLSTCNRTELYAHRDCPAQLIQLLLRHSGGSPTQLQAKGFVKYGAEALRQLFEVTASIDSMVVGDLQIVAQVKQAFAQAKELGLADSYLHKLMQHVLRAHKRARTETAIGRGSASVAHAAVQFVKTRLKDISAQRILLVGAGKIGQITCQNLSSLGVEHLTLMNRGNARAESLAGRFRVRSAEYANLAQEVAEADVVIVATSAPEPILKLEHLAWNTAKEKILVDLSVPRNIDPTLATVPGIHLANMDELAAVVATANAEREACRPAVSQIIDEEMADFEKWLGLQRLGPTIKALNDKLEGIKEKEMAEFRGRLSQADLALVETLTTRIVNKIVAHSVDHMRQHPERSEELAALVQTLFQLELQ